MKKVLLTTSLLCIGLFSFKAPEPQPIADFCAQLKEMLAAAKEGFAPVKGEATTRMITGTEKKFYLSTLKIGGQTCYINDVSSYPECECVLTSDSRITEKLAGDYQSYKKQIKECLGDEWVIMEQDSSNNFYLKGTKYKKLVARENISGKKVKFHLYLYSSMIEKKRVVELKFEGIGKK